MSTKENKMEQEKLVERIAVWLGSYIIMLEETGTKKCLKKDHDFEAFKKIKELIIKSVIN